VTAFAAIVHRRGDRPDVAGVAAAVAAVTNRAASIVRLDGCTLIAAPLHHDDPAGPVSLPSGVSIAGQIVLEDRRHLAATLSETASATTAALIGAAYGKWGERCTGRLSGEYAFVLWDARERVLLSARDGLGIRLLYVVHSPDAVIVTNVLAAALAHPSVAHDLDDTAIAAFLAHGGAADESRTCYRDIRVLPPGHTLAIGVDAKATLRRHWWFPVADERVRTSDAGILEEYRAVLREAVRDRVSQSGTAIFLSGGLDSTTIAAAAAEAIPDASLHAITTRYPRFLEDADLPYARAAADHLRLPLTVFDADKHQPWAMDRDDAPLAAPLDEPMLANWRDALSCAEPHGSVALYGEDGDALFCPPGWQPLRKHASVRRIGMAAARYALLQRRRPYVGLRLRERVGMTPTPGIAVPGWLTSAAREQLAVSDAGVLGLPVEPLRPHPTRPEAQDRLVSTALSRTFAATIAPEVTRRRIELRFPLLDSRVIRLVVSIPAIPWCQHKLLPRRAYRRRLPASVLARPKTPLTGFNEALVAAWRRETEGRVPPRADALAGYIDAGAWRHALQSPDADSVMAAWRVLALDAWLSSRPRLPMGAACIR
jgi:asparagine synthase (glutamine-hydrolysing)